MANQSFLDKNGLETWGGFLKQFLDKTYVRTVNNVKPDSDGNVNVDGSKIPLDSETPHLFWTGNMPATKADGAMQGMMKFVSQGKIFELPATIKVQGDSSTNYAKKNYTVTFYADTTYTEKAKIEFKDWGERDTFVIKAHWIDHSHIRNISCAEIWGKIMESRDDYDTLPEAVRNEPGHGATQGYSLRFWANGYYWGIYEMILPKNTLFGQDKSNALHSLLNSDWNNKKVCTFDTLSPELSEGWTEELQDEMPATTINSFGNIIKLIARNDDDEIEQSLGTMVDIQSVIDFDIFARIFALVDNLAKNQLFATYDGNFWYEGMWDADATCGCSPTTSISDWWPSNCVFQDDYCAAKYYSCYNKLYEKVEWIWQEQFKARYQALRSGVLSINNIMSVFEHNNDRVAQWLDEDYATTTGKGQFTGIPWKTQNNIQQIRTWLAERVVYMDSVVAAMSKVCSDPVIAVGPIKTVITCPTSGATIYYTLDGSTPDENSTVYTGPFEYTYGVTCKAIAKKDGITDSNIVEETLVSQYAILDEVVQNGQTGFMTDYVPNANTETKFEFKYADNSLSAYNWGRHYLSVTGAASGENWYSPIFRTKGKTDGTVEVFGILGNTTEYTVTLPSYDINARQKFEFKNSSFVINDETVLTNVVAGNGTKLPLGFMCLNNKGELLTNHNNNMSNCTFYEAEIRENGNVVRHYLPAYDTTNSVFGVYEECTGTFYQGINNGFTGVAPV